MTRVGGVALAALLAAAGAAAQVPDVLGEVRVHGNHTTPDADVLALAGLTIGAPITDDVLQAAAQRLRDSGRFAGVELRKRQRSIDNPADIVVIVLVEELPGISENDLTPGPFKRLFGLGMWLPVVDYDDGYGWTYGARVTFVDALGPQSRISVPLTWGGERQAALEVDRRFTRGPISRLEGTAAVTRRVNPHFDIADRRTALGARAERVFTPWLRAGGGARLTNVVFGDVDTTYLTPHAEVVLDTRTDPAFPRNAVHLTGGVERLRFDGRAHATRWTTDLRGYVGVIGATVLAVRASSVHASTPLPPYEQPLLGGTASLRAHDFGYRAGDNLAAVSAELRVPLTSPLWLLRLGVKGFVDAGTVYPTGARLRKQHFDRGAGGGVFMTWTVVRMGLDVAWPIGTGVSHRPRWHFGLGVTF